MRIKWFSLIRVTGLVLVLLYHFYVTIFTGGFIGVDVFFIFSGYLITALFIDELEKNGKIDLKAFYQRRFYRIFPPLVLMVLLTIPFTFLVGKDYVTGIGKQIMAALGFTTNYFEIFNGGSYENSFIPHLFVHTWSLAVEVHFYLIWGLVVFLLSLALVKLKVKPKPKAKKVPKQEPVAAIVPEKLPETGDGYISFADRYLLQKAEEERLAREAAAQEAAEAESMVTEEPAESETNGNVPLPQFRMLIAGVSLVFFLISFLSMFFRSFGLKEFSPIYFSSVTHSFPFFMGAILATMCGIKSTSKSFLRKKSEITLRQCLIGFIGGLVTLLILTFTLKFDNRLTYLFGFLIATLAAAVMIYSARFLHEKTPKIKEPKVITFLADISYGVYLFHWPLYTIFSNRFGNTAGVILTTVLSILFASLSYYYVEPLIAGKKPHFYGKEFAFDHRWLRITGTVAAVALLFLTSYVSFAAPKITSLEKNLWISQLYQDEDAMEDTKTLATASEATGYDVIPGVSMIGDSVAMGVRQAVLDQIPDSRVDAEGGRRMEQAEAVMNQEQKKKLLREYVIISIGANTFSDYEERTLNLIASLKPGHRLIFVTPYDGRADDTWDSSKLAVLMRTLPEKYKFVTVADWNKIAAENTQIFAGSDGTHFAGNQEGTELFVNMLKQALEEAKNKPAKTNLD